MNDTLTRYRAARPLGLMAALLLAACAPLPTTPTIATTVELPGTSWRLLEFRPAGGATKVLPTAPDQYVLNFGADGRLTAKVDCNRGNGGFSVVPAQAGAKRIKIGPVATTRMMCPPSALSPYLPRGLEGEHGYRIEGGQLHLDAVDNAGVYVWERAPA